MITLLKDQKTKLCLCLIAAGLVTYLPGSYQSAANNTEEIVDWGKIKSSFDAYLEYPSPENAKAFSDTLPTDYVKVDTETARKVVHYIYTFRNYAILENEIWAGDRYSTEAAFRLLNVADGDFAKNLNMTLGALVRINPRLFLEVLYEYKELWLFKYKWYPVYGVGVGYVDRTKARIYQYRMRIKALESVKDPEYSEIINACVRQLNEAIRDLSN
jgi:hypothetical protein